MHTSSERKLIYANLTSYGFTETLKLAQLLYLCFLSLEPNVSSEDETGSVYMCLLFIVQNRIMTSCILYVTSYIVSPPFTLE